MQKSILFFSFMCVFLFTACGEYSTDKLRTDILDPQIVAENYAQDKNWWTLYKDTELNTLVQKALANNADLLKSAISVNRALYNARLLGEDLVPRFSGETSAGPSKNLKTGTTSHSYQSQLGISYELDLWQKLHNAASAQQWEYLATQEDLEAVRLALINNVVDTYFDLRYLNEAILYTQSMIARYQRLLEITQIRYDLGKVDAVEPLQAAQALLSAQNNLNSLENRRKTAEQTLRDLLNIRPAEEIAIRESDLMDILAPGVDVNVPLYAIGMRPDIRAAENRLQKAFKNLQVERVSWYPSVSLGSTLRTSSDTSKRFFDVPFLAGTVQISFPFLQWNRLRWQVKISEADFETAKLDFTSSVTTALNEVDAAYYNWNKSLQTLDITQKKHEKDVAIQEYYRNRYESGAAELKDYLQAQNTADSSFLSTLEAKYSSIQAENLTFKAMGGRFQGKKD